MTLALSQYEQVCESNSTASPTKASKAWPPVEEALTLISDGPS